jgi:O-antigen/teichoic acid export membrane protein
MSGDLAEVADKSVRGSLLLFLGEAGSTVILAVGSILVARFLGPEYYGVYSISLAVPAIIISLIGLGLDETIVRFSAKLRSENRTSQLLSFMKSAITFRLAVSLVAWLVCFLSSDILASTLLNRPEARFYVKLASLIIIFQALFNLLYNLYVGLDRYGSGAATKISMSIVKSVSAPMLVIIGLGVIGAVLGHVLGFAISTIVAISMLYLGPYRSLSSAVNGGGEYRGSFTGDLKTMIGYGLPLYISSLMLLLVEQYRLILLAHNVSDIEIGNFQAAGNFATLIVIISTPISMALFPAFSKLDPSGEDVRRAFHYSVKYTAMLIVPSALFTILMSRSLVEFIYGHKYQLAPSYLSLYATIYLCSAIGSTVLDYFFNAIGKTVVNLKATTIYVTSFIPLSITLTALYGVTGLILSISISFTLKVVYGAYTARNKLRAPIDFKNSASILVASFAAATPILPLALNQPMPNYLNLLLGGIIYLATYLTVLPIIKGLDKTDIEILGKLFSNYGKLKPIIDLVMKYESKLVEKT